MSVIFSIILSTYLLFSVYANPNTEFSAPSPAVPLATANLILPMTELRVPSTSPYIYVACFNISVSAKYLIPYPVEFAGVALYNV